MQEKETVVSVKTPKAFDNVKKIMLRIAEFERNWKVEKKKLKVN